MDDWSALELEGDDEELENLFRNGRPSAQPIKTGTTVRARPSATSQCSVLQPHSNVFPDSSISARAIAAWPPAPPLILANSRKRSAASLEPENSRKAEPCVFSNLTDTAYDELELDSLSNAVDARAYSQTAVNHTTQNTAVGPKFPQRSVQALPSRTTSQTTEHWHGLPEKLQRGSQQGLAASFSAPAIGTGARTNATHQERSADDQKDSLPGPAGVLQRAQASGMQVPELANLTRRSAQSASQWQRQQHSLHPDFLSPAWQSAMEALDLPCFDGK